MSKEIKVFSRAIRIDENRQVAVTEVPHDGVRLSAMTVSLEDNTDKCSGVALMLSTEAALALSSLLNEWATTTGRE